MQTIQWQDADAWFEEENEPCDSNSPPDGLMVVEEKEDLQAYQLSKYADPAKDENRQAIITIIEKFASLLKNGQIHQIAQELLTEDVEMFIFNSSSLQDVQTAELPQGFINLFQNVQVKERLVRETHVDVEKQTVCQISNCLVMYGSESDPYEELAFEIFSIRDGRISKYRACFGRPCLEMSPSNDPLEPIKREKMLGKVKEINYALAGLPDFEKVAALLYETAEYKIWRWDDFKYFAFYKNEFATAFESLQENMSIKCVIPYDLGVDEQCKFVTGSYVYQLENNTTGEKYDWISTCIYEFDGNINISRVSQQGELYPRGDIDIPFEVHTRQKLETKLAGLYSTDFMNLDKLYSDDILYDCPFWTLCFACKGSGGCIQGLKQVDKFVSKAATFKDVHVEFAQPVDIFVDHHHKGYDVAFSLNCYQGSGFGTLMAEKEERFNVIKMSRLCFENGKLAKSLQLISSLKKPIKTPFDDKSFKCLNIIE